MLGAFARTLFCRTLWERLFGTFLPSGALYNLPDHPHTDICCPPIERAAGSLRSELNHETKEIQSRYRSHRADCVEPNLRFAIVVDGNDGD